MSTIQVCLTIPTLEGVKQWFLQAYQFTVVAHPNISTAVLLSLALLPELPFFLAYTIIYAIPRAIIYGFLNLLGFGKDGVRRDTFASRYQSRVYGGHVPRDSLFSTYQSYGAIEPGILEREEEWTTWRVFLFIFRWVCVAAALAVFFGQGKIIEIPGPF